MAESKNPGGATMRNFTLLVCAKTATSTPITEKEENKQIIFLKMGRSIVAQMKLQ
jgi:hypothetical protein